MRLYFINLELVKLWQYCEKNVHSNLHDANWNFMPVCYLQELSEEIEDYTQRFNTEDQLEWNLVLQEVAAFVEVPTLQDATKLSSYHACYIYCLIEVQQHLYLSYKRKMSATHIELLKLKSWCSIHVD